MVLTQLHSRAAGCTATVLLTSPCPSEHHECGLRRAGRYDRQAAQSRPLQAPWRARPRHARACPCAGDSTPRSVTHRGITWSKKLFCLTLFKCAQTAHKLATFLHRGFGPCSALCCARCSALRAYYVSLHDNALRASSHASLSIHASMCVRVLSAWALPACSRCSVEQSICMARICFSPK